MLLFATGINHHTASVEVREKLVVNDEVLPRALSELESHPSVDEVAVLSTCNRTEIYSVLRDKDVPGEWLSGFHRMGIDELQHYLFNYEDVDAVRHILRVAAGLDSMVLGEPQILGQLKAAYRTAVDHGGVGKRLNKLFQHAFHVAKQIRTDTAIGSSPVSIAFAAVRLAEQIHGSLVDRTGLLVGAGDTIELAANHLRENNLGRLIIANRSLERAQILASRHHGYAITLDTLEEHIAEADIVISATASPAPIIDGTTIKNALKTRRHRPMFMVDIAVPRDIAPEVGKLADVYLYSVDDLEGVIVENQQSRQTAALQANEIVVAQADQFLDWLRATDAEPTIRAMRDKSEQLRDTLLTQARQRIAKGDDPDVVVTAFANQLLNKLMHSPSVRLRDAGAGGRTKFIETVRELYDLPSPDDPTKK